MIPTPISRAFRPYPRPLTYMPEPMRAACLRLHDRLRAIGYSTVQADAAVGYLYGAEASTVGHWRIDARRDA